MTKPFLTTLLATTFASLSFADHGPGTSGSGANTETAETLGARQWSSTLKFDWTEFDSPGDSAAIGKDHFDFIDRSFLTTLSIGVGITENFQLSLAFGYYATDGTRQIAHGHDEGEDAHAEEEPADHEHAEGEEHEHEQEAEPADEHATAEAPQIDSFDPDGWTDLWLTAKYRVYRGPLGQFAFIGGVKFPIGDDRVFSSSGERVEPASTPGTGAWDGLFGGAYTQALGPNVAVDASAQYIVRGEAHDYRLGNRFDAGVALGWRFLGSAQSFPQVNVQGEATVRSVQKSKVSEQREENTGGTVLFLSPGLRVRFNEHAALSVGVQFPVVQELNGDQVETDFRVTSSLNISF
jgi:Putative MetA-pathway of phenol degradation